MKIKNKVYYCYFIISKNRTYIGITCDLKRIKKHNGLLKGGAKSTRTSKNWNYHTIVGTFIGKGQAMRFEWYWKHQKNNKGAWIKTKSGLNNKMKRLLDLLLENEWKHINIIINPKELRSR